MSPSSPFAAKTRETEPSYDPDVVFSNFRGRARGSGPTEAEARARQRGRSSEDRMRGVVVEVRRSRRSPGTALPIVPADDEPTAESVFRF